MICSQVIDRAEEFRSTILARHIAAEEAFVRGDPGPRMELWSRRDPLTLFGANGMSESAWDQLSQTFSWVASRFSRVSDFRIDIELVEVGEDLAYVLWFERFEGSIADRPIEPVTVRVTHIYRRESGAWKIVHRHADNPGHDPRPKEGRPMTDNGHTVLASRAIASRRGDEKALETPAAGHLTFRARGNQTGGALTVFESVIESGEGPPLHLHLGEDEFLYVLEGFMRFRLADDLFEASAGSFVFIPRGMPHAWQNVGEGQVRFLWGLTPGAPAMERFFERSAELAADTRLAEGFGRFASDAGMEVLGPPLAQSHPAPSIRG